MIVICADGLLTLEQRDSRETMGVFVTRAISTHLIRQCADEAEAEAEADANARGLPPDKIRDDSRRAVFELRGCAYSEK